jgi:hypothetical protein
LGTKFVVIKRGEWYNNLESIKTGDNYEILFCPYGGNYRIYLPTGSSSVFSRNR